MESWLHCQAQMVFTNVTNSAVSFTSCMPRRSILTSIPLNNLINYFSNFANFCMTLKWRSRGVPGIEDSLFNDPSEASKMYLQEAVNIWYGHLRSPELGDKWSYMVGCAESWMDRRQLCRKWPFCLGVHMKPGSEACSYSKQASNLLGSLILVQSVLTSRSIWVSHFWDFACVPCELTSEY